MEEPGHRPYPADEAIVRLYRRLLGFVGGLGVLLVALELVPPVVGGALLASLPMALFGGLCLWTRAALRRPRRITYWATVAGFGGVVAAIVLSSVLHGDVITTLFTVIVWSGPLRALAHPSVRRALSGDDEPRGGLRRRLREARERLRELLQPRLRPVPVPIAS